MEERNEKARMVLRFHDEPMESCVSPAPAQVLMSLLSFPRCCVVAQVTAGASPGGRQSGGGGTIGTQAADAAFS